MDNQENIQKQQFDYAWKWFEYHAKQRISMFNFFIVGAGVWGTVLARLFVGKQYVMSATVSIIGILISFVFIFLDYRNKILVQVAEKILFQLEKDWLFKSNDPLFLRQDAKTDSSGILKWDVTWYGKPKIWNSTCKRVNKIADPKKATIFCKHSILIPFLQCILIIFFLLALIASIVFSCSGIENKNNHKTLTKPISTFQIIIKK